MATSTEQLRGETMSGAKFKQIFTELMIKFVENNRSYVKGLNQYTKKTFDPKNDSECGISFHTETDGCHYHLFGGNYLAKVSIPDNANVYIERACFRTDQLIITDIIHFGKVPKTLWQQYAANTNVIPNLKPVPRWFNPDITNLDLLVKAVKEAGITIGKIQNPSYELQLAAIQQTGWAILFIENPSEFICEEAIKICGLTILFIKNPTLKMYLMAVSQNGFNLKYIEDEKQTPEICLVAVNQNGNALQYVAKHLQTPEICMAAVYQSGHAFKYIEKEKQTQDLHLVAKNHLE